MKTETAKSPERKDEPFQDSTFYHAWNIVPSLSKLFSHTITTTFHFQPKNALIERVQVSYRSALFAEDNVRVGYRPILAEERPQVRVPKP